MENNEQNPPEETNPQEHHPEPAAHAYAHEQPMAPLVITEDIRSYLYEMAKWTKFLAIVGFILTGFMVIYAFSIGAIMGTVSKLTPGNPFLAMGSGVLTVVFLLFALMYFYPSFLMFKYGNSAKKAVLFGDQLSLSAAFSNLKSFFKFWGIMTIVIIALYIIMIIMFVAVGSALSGMGH